jgi:hypothetical protein
VPAPLFAFDSTYCIFRNTHGQPRNRTPTTRQDIRSGIFAMPVITTTNLFLSAQTSPFTQRFWLVLLVY